MKTLVFDENNKEAYAMLYEAIIAHSVKGIEEIIKASTVIHKFKEVGEPSGERSGPFESFKLKTIPSTIELEDDHFKYVKETFDATPWSTSIKIDTLGQLARLLKAADAGIKLEK